ncbi:MAG: hypothetical protein PUP90_03075 [Nostoc sp. S4]|nr:hypothetical protein [Nostoc sp. S4]
MNIWIVTTGNSDVQLKHDYDKSKWQKRYRDVRNQLSNHLFEPSRPKNARTEEPYTLPARVMGMVYSPNLDDETYQNLYFPLLDTFTKGLQDKNRPDKIFVILTNQENVFSAKDKTDDKCPYWQDTYTLHLILEKYFQKVFPELKSNEDIKYLELKPDSKEQGLDNWEKCLILVRQEIYSLPINKNTNISVSHQAGTPAISSAVQFTTLAKFDKQVKFLVSNEYQQGNPIDIPSSNYLKGIKLQEAKALLERYDYSGVQEILTNIWENKEEPLSSQEQRINELLTIAISWNCAKFDDFAKYRGKIAEERIKQWWWMGYEAAYLAVIRLKQGNNVESLFHSFRALEGTLSKWVQTHYQHHMILVKKDESPKIKDSIFNEISLPKKFEFKGTKHLYGEFIYQIFKQSYPQSQANPHICQQVWNHVRDERNNLFHQLLGLAKEQVFQAWDTNENDWETRVLSCLNFVSGEKFTSLKEASLMYDVEQELQVAISNYELKT